MQRGETPSYLLKESKRKRKKLWFKVWEFVEGYKERGGEIEKRKMAHIDKFSLKELLLAYSRTLILP